MMNGIFEKARRRAIKALGGIAVEDIAYHKMGESRIYAKLPVRMQACYMNHLNHAEPEYFDFILERLASEMAKGILRDKFYTLNTQETPYGTECRMTVELLPPVDGW